MSVSSPDTVQEWAVYVKSTPDEDALGNLISTNKGRFLVTLREEGFDPEERDAILYFFAKKLQEAGTALPRGGAYDLPGHIRMMERSKKPCVAMYANAEKVKLSEEPDDDDRRTMTASLVSSYPF